MSETSLDGRTIAIGPMSQRNSYVLLHEMAHALTTLSCCESHGADWVGCYMGLLCRHADYSLKWLVKAADDHGLRYSMSMVGPTRASSLTELAASVLPWNDSLTPEDVMLMTNMNIFQAEQALMDLVVAGRAVRWQDPASAEDCFKVVRPPELSEVLL